MDSKLFLCFVLVLTCGRFGARAGDAIVKESSAKLVEEFKNSKVFWQQFEIARKIAVLGDTNVLSVLAGSLTNEDRHVRGNAALIFAGMKDDRGFEVIRTILNDRSGRPEGQGSPGGDWISPGGNSTLQAQIVADRYYAVHLFGDLKDPRAVPILVPLLHDQEVNNIVPWALGEIGDKRAVEPLIGTLSDKDPSMRVLAILSLEKLKAREAVPRLRELLNDSNRSNFGKSMSVAEAAQTAITNLETKP
jgi:HEAT repeat protein